MILTKEVKWKVNNKYIKHYKSLGYINFDGFMYIKVEDLFKQSNYKIDIKCDKCGVENNINYQKYNKNIEKYGIYTCLKCSRIFKVPKTKLKRYGKTDPSLKDTNPKKWEENQEKKRLKKIECRKKLEEDGGKKCKECKTFKKVDEYEKRENHYDGRYSVCRDCINEKRNKKYFDNKEELLPIMRERKRKYAENNRELVNKAQREYYHKVFKKTNKIDFVWRQILKTCLKRMYTSKTDTTYNMLGYSATELKTHLESQFTTGMNWENYGTEWHIDHIRSVATFDKDTPAAVVNDLSNLQPMWATSRIIGGVFYEGNLNKGKKYN